MIPGQTQVAVPGEPGYGIFGPATDAAVREYQRTHGLEVDGRVGRQTWTALLTLQPEVAPDEPGPVKRQTTSTAGGEAADRSIVEL